MLCSLIVWIVNSPPLAYSPIEWILCLSKSRSRTNGWVGARPGIALAKLSQLIHITSTRMPRVIRHAQKLVTLASPPHSMRCVFCFIPLRPEEMGHLSRHTSGARGKIIQICLCWCALSTILVLQRYHTKTNQLHSPPILILQFCIQILFCVSNKAYTWKESTFLYTMLE